MSRTFTGFLSIVGLVMVVLLAGIALTGGGLIDTPASAPPLAVPRENAHSNNHAAEASEVQVRYNAHMCDTLLAFYSPSQGTLLFLCGLPQTEQYGGLVYRVTEDGGRVFLGDEAYKVTVFVGSKSYWNGVVVRDGYQLFAGYTNLQGLVKSRFPGLYW